MKQSSVRAPGSGPTIGGARPLQKEVGTSSRLGSSGGEEKKEEGKNQIAQAIVLPAEVCVSSLRTTYRET
jgi:hypothetical protein